jgi:hypothetical protein
MAECDLLAMPYLSKKYNASTSGIFVEGVCLGIPVLCPCDSWMSDEIEAAEKHYGLKIGRTFRELDDFPSLVETIAGHMDQYKGDVAKFAAIWRQKHNPSACIDVVIRAVDDAVPVS